MNKLSKIETDERLITFQRVGRFDNKHSVNFDFMQMLCEIFQANH